MKNVLKLLFKLKSLTKILEFEFISMHVKKILLSKYSKVNNTKKFLVISHDLITISNHQFTEKKQQLIFNFLRGIHFTARL